jgi:hypothetical protein
MLRVAENSGFSMDINHENGAENSGKPLNLALSGQGAE